MLDEVSTESLTVTHIFDGEEVVTGGEDGQVWIATFATRRAAQTFIDWVQMAWMSIEGERRERSAVETSLVPFRHWAKDVAVPYLGCNCATCEEWREEWRAVNTSPAPEASLVKAFIQSPRIVDRGVFSRPCTRCGKEVRSNDPVAISATVLYCSIECAD